jgi:hypothetical protein
MLNRMIRFDLVLHKIIIGVIILNKVPLIKGDVPDVFMFKLLSDGFSTHGLIIWLEFLLVKQVAIIVPK